MYIKNIKIKKYQLLEEITLDFQPPTSSTSNPETGNIINIVAGTNGSGKTTLLNLIANSNKTKETIGFGLGSFKSESRKYVNKEVSEDEVVSENNDNKILWHCPELKDIEEKEEREHFLTWEKPIVYIKFGDLLRSRDKFEETEVVIVEYLINLERKSYQGNPKLRIDDAISSFNSLFKGAKMHSVLRGFSYIGGKNKPVFENVYGDILSYTELSHGEKALYECVFLLICCEFKNSVILIDEPELGMHPSWQQKAIDILSKIGKNNQFIIATHSPHITANTSYENLIILSKENNKIIAFKPKHPPTGVDVNSILSQIMGVEQLIPKNVENLHKEYRRFIKRGKEKCSDAMKIKKELLRIESNDSKFMQEIRLLIRLRG